MKNFLNRDLSKEELLKKVSKLELEIKDLKKDLVHDTLTGLKTRNFFEEEGRVFYDSALNKFKGLRSEWFNFGSVSFIFIDVDHFKNINDTYGHLEGDKVLEKVADVIKQSIREGDVAARFGGEEIVVELLGASEKFAKKKAEEIRKKIEALSFEIPELKITISAGVSTVEKDISFNEILNRADKAMYKAKENGRNRVEVYSEIN